MDVLLDFLKFISVVANVTTSYNQSFFGGKCSQRIG